MNAKLEKIDRKLSLIVAILILLPSFNYYLNNIFLFFKVGSIGVFIYALLLLLVFYGLMMAFKHNLVKNVTRFIAFSVLFLGILSYIIYNEQLGARLIRSDFHFIYSELLYLFFFAVPSLLLASACSKWEEVVKWLEYFAPVIVTMAFYSWYLVGFSTWGDESMNYMTLSYNVLTAGCICVSYSIRNTNIIYWTTSFLFLFIIVGAGCRGALICTLSFFIIVIYRQVKLFPHKRSSKILEVLLILSVITLSLSFATFFTNVSSWFDQQGVSSRTINSISDNTFFESSGRENIRNAIWKGVWDNPFGYGLYGDRYITSKYYQNGSEYAHNIFFEFIADFGLFIGTYLLLWILFMSYKQFKKCKNTSISLILAILIPNGIIKLFFSDSYLTDHIFFIYIGLLVSLSIYNKRNTNNIVNL